MNISLAGFVLFLHIGFAIIAFMMGGVMHAALHSMPRSRSVTQARPFAALVHRLDPLFPIAALILLGLGAWLIHLSDGEFHWKNGWIVAALAGLIVIEGLGGSLLAPRAKKLVAMIDEAPEGEVTAEIRTAMTDPIIWDIAHIASFGFLGIVFVMAAKPSGLGAAIIIVVAAAIGVALSRWQLAMLKVEGAKAVVTH